MPDPWDIPAYMKRPQRLWQALSAVLVLVLGAGAYAWFNQVLPNPLAAWLTVCTMVLVAIPLVLSHWLRLAWAQRDLALAQVRAAQSQMCEERRNPDPCVAKCSAQRVQALKIEIVDLQAREQVLKVQAHHDALTGLANRILLADHFHFAMERAKRSGKSFALFMVDLNEFKAINDDYGHAAGDAVLVTVARRLMGAVRASDTVARMGGDEFILIIESIENRQEPVHISEKLFGTLSAPITLDADVLVSISASIGLALYPDDGMHLNELLNAADLAMYECKAAGLMCACRQGKSIEVQPD